MIQGVNRWLELIDEHGAGCLTPQQCRHNLLKAESLLQSCKPHRLHYAEFPLLGQPSFDMSWAADCKNVASALNLPQELEGAKLLAANMALESIFGIEYDISETQLSSAGFYFKGTLSNGGHAIGRMLEFVGRTSEVRNALLVVAKLVKLRYASIMCGVMAGRDNAPVRITATPIGEFDAARLMADLSLLGFKLLPAESYSQLNQLCVVNEHMLSAPLIHLDMMPCGTLGPTLGIEFNGVRANNINDYQQLRLAQEWNLADNRWEILREASFQTDNGFFFAPNTLKFRWQNGQALPAKLYMSACW